MIESAAVSDRKRKDSNHDVESMILKMHNKMKSLESRYLDLANFYKKELLSSAAGYTGVGSELNHTNVNNSVGGNGEGYFKPNAQQPPSTS